jgi:histidine ammonia-lyase/tyrosine ammonia-lyase
MAEFLNRRIHPVVPSQGSLGASGDLAPLAHLALPVIGEGMVTFHGERRPAKDVLAEQGLQPVRLGYKEALSLINGTSGMTGMAGLAIPECYHLLRLAVLLSTDLVLHLGGSSAPFEARGHELKNHRGQISIAASIRQLLSGAAGSKRHAEILREMADLKRDSQVVDTGVYIQNAYTLRCVPQILGPVLETFEFASRIVHEELNSCNDNPLIFDTPENIFHGGNFHGQYVAMACDYVNIALTEIGVLAERQLDRLLNPALNSGLPAFLAAGEVGLYSGLEGGQYLATSSASENLDLAAPASVKSIPSNGSNQDVVSMGMIAARKTHRILANVTNILTCLAVACQQAWYLRGERVAGPLLDEFHRAMRTTVPQYRDDCILADVFSACSAHCTGSEMHLLLAEQVLQKDTKS